MPDAATAYVPPTLVPAGTRVILVVSRGPQPTPPAAFLEVPDVVGQTQGHALGALQSSGFNARVFNDYSDSYARGRVMGQLPSGGVTAGSGSEVVLLVSNGPAASHASSQPLPDVVGREETEAVAAVTRMQLIPHVTREYSRSVPAGIVMAQLPNRGWLDTVPRRRSNALIWVVTAAALLLLAAVAFLLLGPLGAATVPNVVGQTQAEAIASLQEADLVAAVAAAENPGSAAPGTVASQSPAAGARVKRGMTVTVKVAGVQPSLVRVPNVRGLAQAEAVQSLEAVGLTTNTRTEADENADPGTVIAQDPTQGARVPAGTAVTLTIAQAPTPTAVEVPQITGVAQADAESTLRDLGLDPLVVENPSADIAEGVVIAQLPSAGENAAAGATIAIVVSTGPPEDATTVAVPDAVGEQLPDAQAAMAQAGFKSQPLRGSASDRAANEVIAQWPDGRSAASPGSTVVLLYSP